MNNNIAYYHQNGRLAHFTRLLIGLYMRLKLDWIMTYLGRVFTLDRKPLLVPLESYTFIWHI